MIYLSNRCNMKKEITRDDILNGWLKYHNTTVEEVVKAHPKDVLDSPDWFDLYPITQEQHDEWVEWAKKELLERTRYSKKAIEIQWGLIYLDTAPNIKVDYVINP
ncbi:MAG: hypothetical protein JXR36_04220 [Bacteroidales bacterium]|nr:hypothetical protein [Bacteroidales bacterium]